MLTMTEINDVCLFGSDKEWKKVVDTLVKDVPMNKTEIVIKNVNGLKSIWNCSYNLRIDNLVRALKARA